MTLERKREILRDTVQELKDDAEKLTPEERQNRLIGVGFAASAVDFYASQDPNEVSIRADTDSLVMDAEQTVQANDERDALGQLLPSRARAIANKQRGRL